MMIFIRNACLVALCYSYALVRGGAKTSSQKPLRSVLVIPASKLGDLICTTPVFRALKKSTSRPIVHVAAAPLYRELLAGNTDVDVFHEWNDNDIFKMIQLVRAAHVDTVVIPSPYFIAAAVCFLAGVNSISVPQVVNGYSPFQTRAYRAILPLLTVMPHHMGTYVPREYLRLLEPMGIHSTDTTKQLAFSDQAQRAVENDMAKVGFVLGTDLIVGISVTAGNKIKEWGTKKFAHVAQWLSDTYKARIVFIGAKGDEGDVKETIGFLRENVAYINTTGLLDFDALKALISKMDVLISVDSGSIYIAEAFGVPTVDIVGPLDEREQPPIGDKHVVVVAPDRGEPQIHIMNARIYDAVEARRQVDAISVEQVKELITTLLQGIM
jgi:ADP-heptose:LPS heptosyltransferase